MEGEFYQSRFYSFKNQRKRLVSFSDKRYFVKTDPATLQGPYGDFPEHAGIVLATSYNNGHKTRRLMSNGFQRDNVESVQKRKGTNILIKR